MVIWLIGLSGAGKTTLAQSVYSLTVSKHKNTIILDGDVIRNVFKNDLGYSLKDRKKNAERLSQLCKFLDDQNINVICAILSLFQENRSWNRNNIKNYYEVFIDAPIKDLIARDVKGLYKDYMSGRKKNIAGLDLKFQIPNSADLTITNDGGLDKLLSYTEQLASLFNKR